MLTYSIQNADRARKEGIDREGSNTSGLKVKRKIGFKCDDEEEGTQGKRQHTQAINEDKGSEKGEGMILEE